MEQLDTLSVSFNEVVVQALDALFEALESEQFVHGDIVDVAQGLECCVAQVRKIGASTSATDMPGLYGVCIFVERNLAALRQRNRQLTAEEYSLLMELPQLLGGYALNQTDHHIESVIWHLAIPTWPQPLQDFESDALRQTLVNHSPEALDAETSPEQGSNTVLSPSTSMQEVLDALMATLALDRSGGGNGVMDSGTLVPYQAQLQALSLYAARSGLDALAHASDAFAQVVAQRAGQVNPLSEGEQALLNLFPLLALDCVAEPDRTDAQVSLLDVVFDPLWAQGESGGFTGAMEVPLAGLLPVLAEPQQVSKEMLQLFSKEFGLMQEILAEDLAAVLAAEVGSESYRDACSNYGDAMARVGETADSIGLSVLKGLIAVWISQVESLSDGLSDPQFSMLTRLPDTLTGYLVCPTDTRACHTLVEPLCDLAWKAPLAPRAAHAWVQALANVTYVDGGEETDNRKKTASAQDLSMDLPKDINLELLDGLLQELPVQLSSFTGAITRLSEGTGSMADVEEAKRAAHTLKGAANTVGVAGIANLTHALEDLLIGLSEKNTLPDGALSALLIEAGDCLETMGEVITGMGPAPAQAQGLLQRVLDYVNCVAADSDTPGGAVEPMTTALALPELAVAPAIETGAAEAAPLLRVPAPVVDELLRLAGENVISTAQIQERLRQTQKQSKAIQKQNALFQKLIGELENLVDVRGLAVPRHMAAGDGDFDPLEFERYSELHTITSQLVEARTDASQLAWHIDEELRALGELLEVQRRLQMENQHAVLRTRLVPVSTIVSRLQRSVRQTCRLLDKQVALSIVGEATHIDSNMLHDLVDPIMHVLRNAVDHGIESASTRLACGKPHAGTIELSFAREGNSIVVRCKDDGAGLDFVAIRRMAVQKNLIGRDLSLSEEELGRLILVTGFSTRTSSTQTSGRGIGMDAVHTRVLEMKGSLALASQAGQGLTVELRLPATLLSEHTLMARIGSKMVAVSSRRILDIHYITRDQIDVIGHQPIYRVGNVVHKLLRLEDLLGLAGNAKDESQLGFPVLITSSDTGSTCAIMVPELVDGREVVVKKLGRYVPKIQGTIGAVILGDGSVAPVIDLPELLRASPARRAAATDIGPVRVPPTASPPATKRTVLIVDDSISARRASAQVMRDAGYEVLTALDGMDAVAVLEQTVPDVVLVDMEMPRMNGLELTAHLRARESSKKIPIIMITSRSTEKHRQQGDSAGVDAYLVKPFNEDQLLQHIDRLVGVTA